MRTAVIIGSLTLALAVGISSAQSLSAPPTKDRVVWCAACDGLHETAGVVERVQAE